MWHLYMMTFIYIFIYLSTSFFIQIMAWGFFPFSDNKKEIIELCQEKKVILILSL